MANQSVLDSLDSILQQKLYKLQNGDPLGSLNNMTSQSPQGNALEYIQPQSFNLEDLFQKTPQNAVERSVGKTPLELPSMARSLAPTQMQKQPMQETPIQQQQTDIPEKKSAGQKTEEEKGKNSRQKRIDSETFPYYKKIKDQAATTAEVDARLDEMEELLNTGKVQGGTRSAFFDALKNLPWFIGKFGGFVEQAFTSPETQVFNKLSTDFLRDAKPYFGSNLSTREVELFLERVPNLMLTNEGNRAVIRNFRALNDYTKAQDAILEGLIAENGGERPRHIESKVQERLKPAAENLRKAFRDSVKLIPKSKVGNFTKQAYEKNKKKQLT